MRAAGTPTSRARSRRRGAVRGATTTKCTHESGRSRRSCYVAAPWSTVDRATATGVDIPIEERASDEVKVINGQRIGPVGVSGRYPAFDVTPAALVTALVTERGVVRAPYQQGLKALDEQR